VRFEQFLWIPTSASSSRKGKEVIGVVWHWTGGWRDAEEVARKDYQRKKNRVSAHFSIGRDGTIVQSVETSRAAWHVAPGLNFMDGLGQANQRFIGVEMCNKGWLTEETAAKTEVHEGRHPNPRSRTTKWEDYTGKQWLAIQRLVDALQAAHPTIKYHCGHSDWYEDRAGAKLDPGPAFPWDHVKWPAETWPVTYEYGSKTWVHRLPESA